MQRRLHADIRVNVPNGEKKRMHFDIASHPGDWRLVRCQDYRDDRGAIW